MAELRLDISLNLDQFRLDLNKLIANANDQEYKIQLLFDQQSIKNELKALEKISPVLKINDAQVIAARDRVKTLDSRLNALRKATAAPIEIKVKYVEIGKPPSGATEQIGRAVSGGVRGSQAIESFKRPQLQNTRKAMKEAGMPVGEIAGNLSKATDEQFRSSIVQGFTNSGQEAVNGFATGLKNASSKIAQAAAGIGEEGVRGIKDALGIASPSKVFEQIGKFSVDGLEIGFSNGLKSFKNKIAAEIRAIVAPLKLEFAKIQDISGAGVGPTVGSLRQQLVGRRMYSAPIGPLPVGSEAPYARGDRGQFGYTGYEPTMVARLRGQAPTAEPNSFLQFSRNAAQIQPPSEIPTGFRGFSQRAAQVQQEIGVGGGSALPADVDTSATVGNIKSLMSAIHDLGGKAAGAAGQIKSKASRALREVGDFISGEGKYDGGYGGGTPAKNSINPPIPPKGTNYVIDFKTNASEISTEIKRVQDEIVKTVRASKTKLELTLDTSKLDSGINASFNKLNRVISLAQKQLNKLKIGGADFNAQAGIVGSLEGKRERGENISNAIRLKAQAGAFEPGSLMRDQKMLEAMRLEASQIRPATQEWINLQQQIAQSNLELQKADQLAENIQLTQTLGALNLNSLAGLETKLTILRNKAKDIVPNTLEWKKLNREIQDLEGSIAKATKPRMGGKERLGAAGGAFLYGGGLSGGAGSAIGGIGGGLIGGVPGAFTGAAIGQAVDDLGKMTAAMTEQATVIKKLKLGLASASNDFGDFAAANQEVERISNSLLIPLEDVYRKFTQLRASTVALGIDTKTTGQMFEGTAVAVLKAGGSMDDVDGAMRAVVQVFSKGKLTAEELRGQLAERLPGAVVEFAKSAGMSVQELDKAFEAGTTSIEQFVVFLKGKSKEGAAFVKEMETSTEYAGARMSKKFETLQITIGQAFQPTGAAFQDFATGVMGFLDQMIALAIQFNLLKPGSDFYEAKALSEGAAGIGNLENNLLNATENQRNTGAFLDKVGIGFMKDNLTVYMDATDKVNNYAKALENLRKAEKLTNQRNKDGTPKEPPLTEEQKKRASTFLDIVERREESLIQAREQHEKDISDIRQDAIKQVQDLEKKYQDQRLQAERDLGKVRRDLVSAQQEAGFLDREANAAFTGEDPEVIDAARQGAEISKRYTEEKIKIEQTAQDRQIALSQDLETFKRTNADAINKASERYAKNTGEIQRNYAKSVAKLIEEGSSNGAKRLAAAGKLVNALLNQATAQKGVSDIAPGAGGIQQSGQELFMGGKLESIEATLARAKAFSSALYAQVYAYVKATSDIDKATKELSSNLPATAQSSTVASTAVSTADLNATVERAQVPLKKMGDQVDSTNSSLNKQDNLFNEINKKINNITGESRGNLIQLNKENELTQERVDLIRQGVLPVLAEEAASLLRNNKSQIKQLEALFNEAKKIAGLSGGDIATINRMQSGAVEAVNRTTAETKAARQGSRDNAVSGRVQTLKDEIQLLSTADDAERRLLELRNEGLSTGKAREIYNLEKVKKNLEDTKALIGNFVSSTSSDYKGFLKAVISGEDAVDALQKFQAGLADKVLTIFLDFTMAPVEEMMKKSLEKLFMPKVNVAEVPITANTTELAKNTTAINNNTTALSGKATSGVVPITVQPFDPTKGLPSTPNFYGNAFNASPENVLTGFDTENMFAGLNDQIRAGLAEIPSSFAEATFNLQTSSEPFKQYLTTDLPKTVGDAGTGVQTQGALFGEGLTNFVGGLGVAAAGITGIAAGIGQIGKGGTSNVLGGIGSILMGAGGAIGGFGKLFGVEGFASGGMVTRPTLGMVGEGRFNEAIVPLPNGRSIPVQLNQDSSLRNAMGSNNSNNATAPVLNMSFETTRIGNTDYVSREQLEAAMLQTRAEATRAGARRGMTMTLDKLQQSPSTRSRVGLG